MENNWHSIITKRPQYHATVSFFIPMQATRGYWVIGQNELVFNPKDKLNMSWIYEAHATQ